MPRLDASSTLDGFGLELPYRDVARDGVRGDAAGRPGEEAFASAAWPAGAWESPYAAEEAGRDEAPAFEDAGGRALDVAGFLAVPTLRRGHRGGAVATLQQLLRRAGAAVSVDGSFGRDTMGAVRAFQARSGLRADGIAGPRTKAALAASGAPAAPPRPAPSPSPASGSGRLVVDALPLLASHRGTGPDLVLRWTGLAGPGEAAVVVHFHGYSGRAAAMRIDRDKERDSGLDFADPADPRALGRTSPTVAILPRGNFFGGKSGSGYDFPALVAPGALRALVDNALARVSRHVGAEIRSGRLIVTGHSGGGAPINAVLAHLDPDEVQVFDGTYGSAENLKAWAARRIARAQATAPASTPETPPALRVLYRPGSGTAANALGVNQALCRALATAPEALRRRFRVDATSVVHNDIPRRFGWRLLADAGADLPDAKSQGCPGLAPAGADEASPHWISPATEWEEALRGMDVADGTAFAGYAPNASDLDSIGEAGDVAGEELAWLDYEEASEDDGAEPGAGERGEFAQDYRQEYGEGEAWDAGRDFGEDFGDGFGEDLSRDFGEAFEQDPAWGPSEAWGLAEAWAPAEENLLAAEDGFDPSAEAFGGTALETLEALLETEAGPGSGLADELKGIAAFVLGPTLRRGSQGAAVATLQRVLSRLGADLAVDGVFGRNTERVVRAFQSRSALAVDGIVGPATKAAIAATVGRDAPVPAPSPAPPSPVPAGDAMVQAIVRIAEEEYRLWNQPHRRLTETQPAATPVLQRYYREGVRQEIAAADLQSAAWQEDHPWSAVFISYVMRKAGAGAGFSYSAAHQTYIAAAKANRLTGNAASPFWAYRADEVVPEIGDLICRSRAGSGANYDTISDARRYKTHSDIVTAVSPGELRVVGGNVNQNVDAKTVRTRPDGRVALDRDQSVIFAIVRCRGAWGGAPARPQSLAPPGAGPLSAPAKLSPRDFVRAYAAAARASEAASRVPALVTLGQAALESGWGAHAPRFNFFGIKAKASDPPETRQLLRTREVFRDKNHKFPEIISITPRPDGAYDYVVRDWFRAYPSAEAAFLAHGQFLVRNKRYAKAFLAGDPYAFASAVAAAGYATDPSYGKTLHAVMRKLESVGFA